MVPLLPPQQGAPRQGARTLALAHIDAVVYHEHQDQQEQRALIDWIFFYVNMILCMIDYLLLSAAQGAT